MTSVLRCFMPAAARSSPTTPRKRWFYHAHLAYSPRGPHRLHVHHRDGPSGWRVGNLTVGFGQLCRWRFRRLRRPRQGQLHEHRASGLGACDDRDGRNPRQDDRARRSGTWCHQVGRDRHWSELRHRWCRVLQPAVDTRR